MIFIHAHQPNVINMNFKKIISIIAITILLSGQTPITFVRAEDEPTKPESECEEMRPDFEVDYNDLILEIIDDPEAEINIKTIDKFLGTEQEKYHEYVQCMFDYAEDQILDSGGAKTRGTAQANAPAFPWFKPEAACIIKDGKEYKMNEALQASAPSELIPPLLKIHQEYANMLNKIAPKYEQEGTESGEGGENLSVTGLFAAKSKASRELRSYIESEIDNSLVAIDITFTTLKELRMAFLMHVQFQCMLNNLEKYRKALESIRTIVSCLPAHLEDASVTK